MRIHHLNCGSMNPAGIPLTTRVLVVELGHRVVLVDSGFGTAYVQQPDDPHTACRGYLDSPRRIRSARPASLPHLGMFIGSRTRPELTLPPESSRPTSTRSILPQLIRLVWQLGCRPET